MSCTPFPQDILATPPTSGSASQTLVVATFRQHFISYSSSVAAAVADGFDCFTLCLSLISLKIENSLRTGKPITVMSPAGDMLPLCLLVAVKGHLQGRRKPPLLHTLPSLSLRRGCRLCAEDADVNPRRTRTAWV